MLRLTGILVGSALAIALFLLTLGTPQLPPPSNSGSVSDPQGLGSVSVPQGNTQVTDFVDSSIPIIPDKGVASDPEPASLEIDPEPADPEPAPPDVALVDQLFAPEGTREIVLPTASEEAVEEHWYAFWSPFRSEIAANGFVAKLQESTGIDYRVVKVKTGVYEVAFAYTDDADIEAKLERISGATGLELSGS
jgi:hypothetical protein